MNIVQSSAVGSPRVRRVYVDVGANKKCIFKQDLFEGMRNHMRLGMIYLLTEGYAHVSIIPFHVVASLPSIFTRKLNTCTCIFLGKIGKVRWGSMRLNSFEKIYHSRVLSYRSWQGKKKKKFTFVNCLGVVVNQRSHLVPTKETNKLFHWFDDF